MNLKVCVYQPQVAPVRLCVLERSGREINARIGPCVSVVNRLIHNFLESSAARFPDKVAVIHEKSRATYRQINTQADQLAAFLRGRAVHKGDRVVILLENSCTYVVAYYGILKAGAVAVPLSTDLKPDGLNFLLAELEPAAIISSSRFERLLQAFNLDVPNLNTLIIKDPKLNWSEKFKCVFSFQEIIDPSGLCRNKIPARDQSSKADIELEAVSVSSHDLASIIYTSGSTGNPKGVMLSHANIVANVDSICAYLELTDSDVQMVVLPFFYVMGKSLLNTLFAAGGTLVINNKFAFPATVINQMIEAQVTLFSGVPSTFAYLLHRSPLAKHRQQLNHLRMVTQAGGHMARSVKTELRKVLPDHTKICIMYGATEASARLTWLNPDDYERKIDSIGRAIPGVTIKILDNNGELVAQGGKGEIVASGSNIMQGYWKDAPATANVLDADGYHTGDLGWQDQEGFIYLEGRKDNLLKVGGHRINPQEVEDALLATQLAVEVAVVGLPDALLGARLAALVVPLNDHTSVEEMMGKCASVLPGYKLPSDIKFIRSLPKSANGKINRNKCLSIAAGR